MVLLNNGLTSGLFLSGKAIVHPFLPDSDLSNVRLKRSITINRDVPEMNSLAQHN